MQQSAGQLRRGFALPPATRPAAVRHRIKGVPWIRINPGRWSGFAQSAGPCGEERTSMDSHRPHHCNIWAAAAHIETLNFESDQAHDALLAAVKAAQADGMPLELIAAAAGKSVAGILKLLSRSSAELIG